MTHDAHPACRRNCWLTAALTGLAVAAFTRLVSHAEVPVALFLGGLVGVGLGGFLRWAFCAGRIAYVTPAPLAPVPPFIPMTLPTPYAAPLAPVPQPDAAAQPAAQIEMPASSAPIMIATPPALPVGAVPEETVEDDKSGKAPARPIRSGPFAPLDTHPDEEAAASTRRAARARPTVSTEKPARPSRARTSATGAGASATERPAAKPRTSDRRAETKPAAALPPRASGLDFAVNRSKVAGPVGAAPEMLAAPRDGRADDLKEIRGIGPVIETLLNQLGFWHFDQIASWKARDIAYVDERLVGFHGRISRDEWVRQAQVLAAGGTTEHARAVRRKGGST